MRPTLVLLLTLLAPHALGFTRGDLAIASRGGESGGVLIVSNDGAEQRHVGSPTPWWRPEAVQFEPSGRLLVSRRADGPVATETFTSLDAPGPTLPIDAVAFAADRAGRIYAAPDAGGAIRRYTSSGVLLDTFPAPRHAIVSLDLASDQCTLYYGYELPDETGRIGRHDVCTDTALADVPIVLPQYTLFARRSLRILPDGTLLAVTGAGAQRITAAGTTVQTYAIAGAGAIWSGLALDTTGTSVWIVADDGGAYRLYRFSLASGVVLSGPITVGLVGQPMNLSVLGEARAATVAASAAIPTLHAWMLMMLAATIVGLAMYRLA